LKSLSCLLNRHWQCAGRAKKQGAQVACRCDCHQLTNHGRKPDPARVGSGRRR
jgi:hypothetical protein